MNFRQISRHMRSARGFSMIDVLISIVVMATALLALAVLQGTVTRNTADARARSLIAQAGDAMFDLEHQSGYSAISVTNGTTTITPVAPASPSTCSSDPAGLSLSPKPSVSTSEAYLAYCAQKASGVSNLSIQRTVTEFTYADPNVPGAPSITVCNSQFVQTSPPIPAVYNCPLAPQPAQYKNVNVTMAWTDAAGASRTLAQNTIVSSLSLDTSNTLVQRDYGNGGVTAPAVRTTTPAVPGVIPIAISANTNTAATNPKPELSGISNATSYNVLTYKSISNSTQVQIQQRIETNVIGCSCEYGHAIAAPDVFAQTWRPTYWDGLKYGSPKPATASLAGEDPAMAVSNNGTFKQSPLCSYCCRDHRDYSGDLLKPDGTNGDDPVNFDYVRFAAHDPHDHYRVTSTSPTVTFAKVDTSDTTHPYLEACRMIRVDGLWRTATDMIAEQAGLLATDSSLNIGFPTPTSALPATTWIPSADAETQYQSFVKDYLNQRVAQSGSPNANNLYHSYALDDPAILFIQKTPTLYLDARGLYLDHLEDAAVKQITSAADASHCTSGVTIDCVLPYIPFTSINLTEVAVWNGGLSPTPPTSTNVTVNSGGVLCDPSVDANKCDPTKTPPKGGVVLTGSAGGAWDAVLMSISASNRGLTTSRIPIDAGDATLVANYASDTTTHDPTPVPAHTDIQHFKVTALAGDSFTVSLSGSPLTSDGIFGNDPTVNWVSNDGTDTGPYCNPSYSANDADPDPYGCQTDLRLNAITAPVAPLNLQVQGYTYILKKQETDPCNTALTTTHSYCEYYQVSEVDLNGTALAPQPTVSTSNSGKTSEISQFQVPGLLANGKVTINFIKTSEVGATPQACDTSTTPPQPVTWNAPPCQ